MKTPKDMVLVYFLQIMPWQVQDYHSTVPCQLDGACQCATLEGIPVLWSRRIEIQELGAKSLESLTVTENLFCSHSKGWVEDNKNPLWWWRAAVNVGDSGEEDLCIAWTSETPGPGHSRTRVCSVFLSSRCSKVAAAISLEMKLRTTINMFL